MITFINDSSIGVDIGLFSVPISNLDISHTQHQTEITGDPVPCDLNKPFCNIIFIQQGMIQCKYIHFTGESVFIRVLPSTKDHSTSPDNKHANKYALAQTEPPSPKTLMHHIRVELQTNCDPERGRGAEVGSGSFLIALSPISKTPPTNYFGFLRRLINNGNNI